MRTLIVILIVLVVGLLVALKSGFLDVNQTREAKAPQVSTTRSGVTAQGGQAPAFDVATGSVKVETKETTVRVPAVVVQKPGQNQTAAVTNNSM
jgi:hypothetical protein